MTKSKPSTPKRLWTAAEDRLLFDVVLENGPRRWNKIAKHFENRKGTQCRERWLNHVCPDVVKTDFSKDDDEKLLRLVAQYGTRWCVIRSRFPGRSDSALKNHYCSLVRRDKKAKKGPGTISSPESHQSQSQSQSQSPSGATNEDYEDIQTSNRKQHDAESTSGTDMDDDTIQLQAQPRFIEKSNDFVQTQAAQEAKLTPNFKSTLNEATVTILPTTQIETLPSRFVASTRPVEELRGINTPTTKHSTVNITMPTFPNSQRLRLPSLSDMLAVPFPTMMQTTPTMVTSSSVVNATPMYFVTPSWSHSSSHFRLV